MTNLPESCDGCMYGVQCVLAINYAGGKEHPGDELVKLVPNPCPDKEIYDKTEGYK